MSRTFTHRLGTNLDKFPEDKIIVCLGSNHAPTDRYQIVHPGEQKPRYPNTRAKNLNEVRSMARLLIRRHEERAKFVRRCPARPDDINAMIGGQRLLQVQQQKVAFHKECPRSGNRGRKDDNCKFDEHQLVLRHRHRSDGRSQHICADVI